MITALAGGVGAAKFLKGLSSCLNPEDLRIIVNTGDDIDMYGLRVSPDIDTVIYRLSDRIDRNKGWGLENDTFNCLDILSELGYETWFRLGDRDFAVQLFKKNLGENGITLSGITRALCARFNLDDSMILPMSDQRVESWIETDIGSLHFQEYYIKYSMTPAVRNVVFKGAMDARPAPGVIDSIMDSDLVILCPSNPIISIGPILEIEGIYQALLNTNARIVSISPLIGGKPLKGPADRLMKGLGMEVSSTQIAKIYKEFLDVMVIDNTDENECKVIEELGMVSLTTDTVMNNQEKSERLSRKILDFLGYD